MKNAMLKERVEFFKETEEGQKRNGRELKQRLQREKGLLAELKEKLKGKPKG